MGTPGEPPAQEQSEGTSREGIAPSTSHMAAGLCQIGNLAVNHRLLQRNGGAVYLTVSGDQCSSMCPERR